MTQLSERDRTILAALIERHIATAEPVSSQELCTHYGFTWSTATVRNVVVRLEAAGYVSHPYTSAGKIPTVRAFRYFVESLLSRPEGLAETRRQAGFEILQEVRDTDKIIKLTAKVLAMTSQLLAISWVPEVQEARLAKIQLVRLTRRRLLLVMENLTGENFRQVFDLEDGFSADLLRQTTRLVNQRGRGRTAGELERLAQAPWPGIHRRLAALLRRALHWAGLNLNLLGQAEVVVEGAANLLQQPEFNDLAATRQLVSILDNREELVRPFKAPGLEQHGIRVVIGEDSQLQNMPPLALVTEAVPLAPAQCVRIGVIGPRRMAYHRIIPLVVGAAKAMVQAAGVK